MSDDPVREELRLAMKCLMAGDTAGRDRHCARAEAMLSARKTAPVVAPIKLVRQADGTYAPERATIQ